MATVLAAVCAVAAPGAAAVAQEPRDLGALLLADGRLQAILREARAHRLQVLLGEPHVTAAGRVELVRSRLGDARQYFYPASTVKLGAAVAALVELNRINAALGTAFDLDVELQIAPRFAGDPPDARFALRRDLRLLFLRSDNPAFNHCYELVGPQRLNAMLHEAGFPSWRLWHRLAERRPLREQRATRAVTLRQHGREHLVPARQHELALDNSDYDDLLVGDGHLVDGELVARPMSFAQKNAVALEDLQDMLAAVVRPEIATGRRGFPELSLQQRAFLVQALGELPRESRDPVLDAAGHPDEFCKFILPGVRRVVPAEHVRVYDKIGRAYGFSIENAYVEDMRSGRGFFLAAVLYTNPDGVLDDDRYGYAEIADPFLVALGEVVTRAVLGGDAAKRPDAGTGR